MDIEKNDYDHKIDLISMRYHFCIIIFHIMASIVLLIYVLTSLWFLQQFWSTNDNTWHQMSLVTDKFSYSIRSLLLLAYLQ